MAKKNSIAAILLAAAAAVSLVAPAHSESAEGFYKGKQLHLVIGYNPGGAYDIYARVAATLLPKYLPGSPKIVAQNMPGVGSAKAANYLFQQASRDGLTIGMIGQQLPVSQALGDASAKFDIRQFTWLGRFTSGGEATVVWHISPTKSLADAMKRETTLAATSAGSSSDSFPLLMNRIAGTKFKMHKGHRGITGTVLAMQRGETEGAHTTLEQLMFANRDWLRDKQVTVLVQYTPERHPSFPNVPAMTEFGKTPLDKQVLAMFAGTADIGRALMLPPGVPADRVALLRKAFDAMVKDPAFKAEVDKRNLEFGPMSGAELQKRVAASMKVTPEVIKHAIAMSR
ncbi:MAG: Bug family tripartite tricarboxylate transporter substrate binding protein [Xanthobacteraceae bacterium]